MQHSISNDDRLFKNRIESCAFPVSAFNHRAHVRLAYIYLVSTGDTETAFTLMRQALFGLLAQAGVDPAEKYHATLTKSWILAVDHFLHKPQTAESADAFIEQHTELLDSNIMLTHYSAPVLFSDASRNTFVEPDLDPIPRHGW